jgi:hypothetical protein
LTTNIINVAGEKNFNRVEVEGCVSDAFEQTIAKFESELGRSGSRFRFPE